MREGYKGQHAEVEERVKDGVFGAMMQVGLVNDGPVSVIFCFVFFFLVLWVEGGRRGEGEREVERGWWKECDEY